MIFNQNRIPKILIKLEDLKLRIDNYIASGKAGFWKSGKELQRTSQCRFQQGPGWHFFSSFCSFFFLDLGWGVFPVDHHNLMTFNSWLYLPQRLQLIISTASFSLVWKTHTAQSCCHNNKIPLSWKHYIIQNY